MCLFKAKYLFLSLFWVHLVTPIQNALPYWGQTEILVIEWLPSITEAFIQMLNTEKEGGTKEGEKEKCPHNISNLVDWVYIIRLSINYNKCLRWLTYE